MTTFWLIAAGMILLALALLIPALIRRPREESLDRASLNVAVVREQLAELDADIAAGKLDEASAAAARHDLERELLDALDREQTAGAQTAKAGGRWLAPLLALALPAASVLLYLALGNPDLAPRLQAAPPAAAAAGGAEQPPTQHDIEAMLARLQEKLEANPNHPEGWALLGRSYTSLQRYDEALAAYQLAREYGGDTPELLIDHADALIAAQGGNFTDEAGDMLRRSLAQQPDNPKGLWLMGHWHFQRGDYRQALERWQRVAALIDPASKNGRILAQQIRMAQAKLGIEPEPALEPIALPAPAQAEPSTSGNNAGAGASIRVQVDIAPALKARLNPDHTLFIFARAASGPRMPLAIVRKKAGELPVTVTLDDSQAMSPAMRLSAFPQVVVGARVSASGQAMPASGDLEGYSKPVATGDGKDTVNVLIDHQVGG